MENIISLGLIFFEIICCTLFFETFGERRNKGWKNYIHIIVTMLASALIVFAFPQHVYIRQIVILWVLAVMMYLHVELPFHKTLLLSVLMEALILTIDYIAYVFNNYIFSLQGSNGTQSAVRITIIAILSKLCLYLCVIYVRKIFGKTEKYLLVENEWVRLLSFPTLTIVIIVAMLYLFQGPLTKQQGNLLLVISFGLALLNMLTFYLVKDISERNEQKRGDEAYYIQAKNQASLYHSISENFDIYKRRAHEYKNQILCLEALIQGEKYDEAREFIEKIYGRLKLDADIIDTNNVIINAVLNTKFQEAKDKGIAVIFRINDLAHINMKDEDIVTLISNLLDNAIEAAENAVNKKVIKVRFEKQQARIIIAVENPTKEPVEIINNTINIERSKKGEGHGIGVKNIIRIINQYNGIYSIKYSDGYFLFSIIFLAETKTKSA